MSDNRLRDNLVDTLSKYIGADEARMELERVCAGLGLETGSALSSEDFEKVVAEVEKSMGKEVGAAMARAMITDRLEITPRDVGRFYESFNRIRKQLLERQRRAEKLNEELARLKELYENVSMSIPMGLCSADMNMRITTWNKGMEDLSGVPAERAIGQKAPLLLPDYEPLMVKALTLRKVARDTRFETVVEDGGKRIENVTVSPLLDKYGVLRGVVLSAQDITIQMDLEENVKRAEKLASVGRLAAGVAHEVGNPLTSISSLVQELAAGASEDKEFLQSSLVLIEDHIRRITEILSGLVDYSRKKDTEHVPCSLSEIVDKAAPLLKLDKRGHDIDLEIDLQENMPPVYCDPDQIQQVLLNLLFNAADAMEGKGKVTLRASAGADATVTVSVRDHGKGMTSEGVSQAMTPFYTTKPVGAGTGLGLYVCYNILDNHGSKLTFTSAPGEGTVAEFDLKTA